MVSKESAIFSMEGERRYDQLSRDVDHSNLAKFGTRADQDYVILRGRISECVKEAPAVIKARFTQEIESEFS